MKAYLFKTQNAVYAYDGLTNMVVPLQPISNEHHEIDKAIASREALLMHTECGLQLLAEKYSLFRDSAHEALSEDFYRRMLWNYPRPQLVLEMTERCNLRCKYCIYSGRYESFRRHSIASMSDDVMRRSVEHFFRHVADLKSHNPNSVPAVSFYGGEPLLAYDSVVKAIDFALSFGTSLTLELTTNATLLDRVRIKELVARHVHIAVSLDGSSAIHDRNRIYPDGSGTFDDVREAISSLKGELERQRTAESVPLMVLVTVSDENDAPEINDFFQRESDLFSGVPIRVSSVRDSNPRPPTPAVRALYKAFVDRLRDGTSGPEDNFLMAMYGSSLVLIKNRPFNLGGSNYSCLLGGSCVPGNKVFVTTDGTFHMCERINGKFAIGSHREGIDFGRSFELLKRWSMEVSAHCGDCPFVSICGLCPANCCSGEKFNIGGFCRRQGIRESLAVLYAILESSSNAFQSYERQITSLPESGIPAFRKC